MTTMSTTTMEKTSKAFTDDELAAMKNAIQEQKTAARRGSNADRADGEADVLAKIAEMPAADRAMAERLHALITATVPALVPRTYYGMPAYARDGNVVCFFKNASKFKTRYATLGFSDKAKLDDGEMWPTEFALKTVSVAVEDRIIALIKQAVS